MTPEVKKLLFKDLCARLPYGVIIKSISGDDHGKAIDISYPQGTVAYNGINGCKYSEDFKPYLRSMSSMTEEEEEEYELLIDCSDYTYFKTSDKVIDWLNAHHFDYRIDPSTGKTLIESGLAIEAPKGMYEIHT